MFRAAQVQVATVDVDDRIRLREAAPPLLHVAVGRKVRFVVPYNLAGATPHRESYKLTLETRLDRGKWVHDTQHHDIGLLRRSVQGRLAVPVRSLRAGERVLEYRVAVEYDVRAAGSGQPLLLDRKEAKGRITLRTGASGEPKGALGVGA